MSTNKTAPTDQNPREFIASIPDDRRRREATELIELFEDRTGVEAVMWGDSIVGFGTYEYTYASGTSGEWMRTGFSPRKSQMTVYVMPGFEKYAERLDALGPHSLGKSCLYLKRLDTIDTGVLGDIVEDSYRTMGS